MRSALRIFIFVIVMGTASSLLLVGVDAVTSPLIFKNEELKIKSSVLDALQISYDDKTKALATFDDKVKTFKIGQATFYSSADGAVAFKFRGPGLWGPIAGIASLNPDLKSIKTIKITHQEETPGLGGRIAEASFLKQFVGKEFLPRLLFVPQGKAGANNEVDAITGATGSSKALEKLLNETLHKNVNIIRSLQ